MGQDRSGIVSVRILVLGGAGMLGHKMFEILDGLFPDVWCTLRRPLTSKSYASMGLYRSPRVVRGLDVTALADVQSALREIQPNWVVNCVGVVKQRPHAADAVLSITINSLLPHVLADTIQEWNGRLIHFSTDCVFSGSRGNYCEDDLCDATDLYGRSKALGEVGAQNALTLRTSIIGRELSYHESLLEWFLAQRGRTVKGFRRAWWSGVTTNHLARVVAGLISRQQPLSGIYQLSSGRTSKYDLLLLIRDAFALNIEIVPDDAGYCDRSLDGTRFARATGYASPPWHELLAELVQDPFPYSDVIAHESA
jgi:dTDP-4-dehydrorhamnose reductase